MELDMSVEHEEVPAPSTPASTPNPLEPIMPLDGAFLWLRNFFEHEPPYVEGDDLGTNFCSVAAVVLSAMVVGTESPIILAGLTSFPISFVAAVLKSMQGTQAWALENVIALKAKLVENPEDWTEIQLALNDAMEMVWDAICMPGAQTALESLRRRVLYGGETQWWLDEDSLEFFDVA
jgi:hypothetical protein